MAPEMHDVRIRVMTIADYDAVHALWLSSKGMGLNDVDDSREGIDRYLRRNPSTCFVAQRAKEIVGVILAGHDGRRGYIYHTSVREDCRGAGIGTQLVNHALEAFRQEGIAKAALVVFARNENGNAFWERMGFSTRGDLAYRNRALIQINRVDT